MRLEYRRLHFLQTRSDSRKNDATADDGIEASEQNPLANRTFLLQRDGATFRVLTAAGAPVEQSLARLVLDEECVKDGQLHRAGDLFARELADRQLMPGDEIELSHDVARAFVDGRDGLEAVSMKVVLMPELTADGQMIAAFDTRLQIHDAGADGTGSTNIELTGVVRVDVATGHYLSADLTGTLALGQTTADASRAVEVVGSGPWKITEKVTYARVP
jgi:hypothetical protein